MKKIAVIMGTRPEVIKLAPVVRALRDRPEVITQTISTAQHGDMLIPLFKHFEFQPDINLKVMRRDQTPLDVASRVMHRLGELFNQQKPDAIIVQGDTTTVFAAAFTAAYFKIPVFHVEAGMRTDELYNPFPEEINRRLVAPITSLHFAATEWAKENLLKEGIKPSDIKVTGNTVIDALLWTVEKGQKPVEHENNPLILVTAHRRENFGAPMENVFQAIKALAGHEIKPRIVYPVHPNPAVKDHAYKSLSGITGIELTDPMSYSEFAMLLSSARLILTDSGGIQEEAPALNVPVVVLRNVTERPEAVKSGAAILAGTDTDKIFQTAKCILEDDSVHQKMAEAPSPYGDGRSAERIVDAALKKLDILS